MLLNLLQDLPDTLAEELVDTLVESSNVRVERIVSTGQRSADDFWYDQEEHEWVVVLQGAARLVLEGEEQPLQMRAGDHVLIPAHKRHRVDWTSTDEPTVWLAVFYR